MPAWRLVGESSDHLLIAIPKGEHFVTEEAAAEQEAEGEQGHASDEGRRLLVGEKRGAYLDLPWGK